MIEDIIKWFGSKSKMARRLGVDRSAVTHWQQKGSLPPMRAIQVERISDGKFRAVDIMEVDNDVT